MGRLEDKIEYILVPKVQENNTKGESSSPICECNKIPSKWKENADRKSVTKLIFRLQVLKSMDVKTERAQWVPSKMND